MVEHLLCKQGVIGSNPIVSRTGVGLPVVFMGWFLHRCVCVCPRERGVDGRAVLPRGGSPAVLVFCVVNLVLVRLWTRRTTRLRSGWRGLRWSGLWQGRSVVWPGALSDRKGSWLRAAKGRPAWRCDSGQGRV